MEEWNVMIDGYSVSNLGRIRNDNSGYIRKQQKRRSKSSYVSVVISGHNYDIHKWVAIKFVPNPDNLPEVRHLDGNPENNVWTNLAWGTHKDNIHDSIKAGTHTSQTSESFKNQQNEKLKPSKVKRKSKSGVKGISIAEGKRGTKYRVFTNTTTLGSKYVGSYDTMEEAVSVHREEYYKIFGEYPSEVK